MSKSTAVNDLAAWLRQVANNEGESRKQLWELTEAIPVLDGLDLHVNSLQRFQRKLAEYPEKPFIRYDLPDYNELFRKQYDAPDGMDYSNDTTAALIRMALATMFTRATLGQSASTPVQIVASMPDYFNYAQQAKTRNSYFMYHWHLMRGTVRNWYRYEQVFLKDIKHLIQVRNGERTPRNVDEQVMWDVDLFYCHYLHRNPAWDGRAPFTPLGKAILQLE